MSPLHTGFRAFLMAAVTVAVFGASAQSRSLPSNSRDDYDNTKYESILSQHEQIVNRARYDLQGAEDRLRDAQRREERKDREMRESIEQLRRAQGREREIEKKLEENKREEQQLSGKIQGLDGEVKILNSQVDQNVANQNRLQEAATSAKADADAQQTKQQELQKAAQGAKKTADIAAQAVSAQEAIVQKLNADLAAAAPEAQPAIQEQLNIALAAMPALLAARTSTQEAANQAQSALEAQKTVTQTAKAKADQAQTDLAQATQTANQVKKMRDDKQKELGAAQKKLADSQKETQELTGHLADVRGQINRGKDDVEQNERQLRRAQKETNQAQYERDGIAGVLISSVRDRDNAAQYLAWVENNRAQAFSIAGEQANRDGSVDGTSEAEKLAEVRGEKDGREQGLREGKAEGTRQGRARDRAEGVQIGEDQAEAQAKTDSDANGERDGKIAGEAQGIREGLEAAYQAGKAAGKIEGQANASDRVAYEKGRLLGKAAGEAKAKKDAAYRDGEGYTERENYYLNQPLKDAQVGFNGLQGRYSTNGDDSEYRPRPANYPHEDITSTYYRAYDDAYRLTLDDVYSREYARVHEINRAANHKAAKAKALALDYPDSREEGRVAAYKETYKPTYDKLYKVVLKARTKHYRDIKFEENKNDKTKYDIGFAEANAFESEAKGYSDGHSKAHAENIELEKQAAFKAGYDRAEALYTQNAIMKYESIQIVDADGDGIFRPGEEVRVVAKMKNFGLVAKSDLVSALSNAEGAITITQDKVTAASLPPQSNITVILPAQAAIERAREGSAYSLDVKLVSGSNAKLSKSFSGKALYPVVAEIQEFDGILLPGEPTEVTIALKNRSQSAQNLQVSVAVDSSRVNIDRSTIQVADLAAGASKSVKVTLTGRAEAQFEESALKVTVTQNDQVFATAQGLNMTIIKRHSPTQDSKGLILSNNLALGGGKVLFKKAKFDTWDLRVDSKIITVESLRSYIGRAVHILADEGSSLDTTTFQSLSQYVKLGGTIVIWGDNLGTNQTMTQLGTLAGVQSGRAVNVAVTASGKSVFESLNINLNGMISPLTMVSAKARPAFASAANGNQNQGVFTFNDGIADKSGWIVTLGMKTADLSEAQMAQLNDSLALLGKSFQEKLDLAVSKPLSGVKVLVLEIINEIIQADANNTGKYYVNNEKKTKLFRAVQKIIEGKNSSVTAELAKYYTQAADAVAKIRNNNEEWRAENLLDKKFGGVSWKTLYCKGQNSSNKYCKKK